MQTRNRPKVFYKMTYAQEGGISISKGFYNTFWVAANVSKVSTNNGWAIFLNKATIISLFSFRITTLIPTSLDSTNITLSKFAFTLGASRGFHLDLARLGQWTWTQVFLLYSDRRLRIYSRILWEGKQCSLLLILFRRHRTEQATLANNSSLGSCVSTTETKALRGVKMRIINFHLAERFHYSDFMVTIILNVFYGEVNKVHYFWFYFVNTTLTRPPSQIIPACEVAYPPLKQGSKWSEDEDDQFSPSQKISL